MRALEFITESKTASAEAVWNYVKKIHPADQQGGGFLEQLIKQYSNYKLQYVPLASLIIHDQESDDPDEEPDEDPYGRVQIVDPEYAGEVSVHNLDRNPIVIDSDGHILDGNHRAWAAAELLGRDTIQAWVPVESITESKIIHRDGVDIRYTLNRNSLSITALAGGKEMGAVDFRPIVDDSGNKAWEGDNLYVDERFRGQGIASVMYDVARDLVGRIVPSNAQTDAGKSFWAKHRPGQEVWEEK